MALFHIKRTSKRVAKPPVAHGVLFTPLERRWSLVRGSAPVPSCVLERLQAQTKMLREFPLWVEQELTKMLSPSDSSSQQRLYRKNTLKCRPRKCTPLPTEIEACYPFLLRQIFEVKPKILILLGSPAMKTILNPTESISKMRGRWVDLPTDYQEAPIKVITLFHPTFLLRNPSKETGSPKWHTWNDLQAIRSELNNS